MRVQVCGGVALDGALTEGGGGGNLEEVPLSNLANSLASSPVLCSDIHTSMSTLKHSILSALTKYADFSR